MIKKMRPSDVFEPPAFSPEGTEIAFEGHFLQNVEWHLRRDGVVAICDEYGYTLIMDVFRKKTFALPDDVSFKVKMDLKPCATVVFECRIGFLKYICKTVFCSSLSSEYVC